MFDPFIVSVQVRCLASAAFGTAKKARANQGKVLSVRNQTRHWWEVKENLLILCSFIPTTKQIDLSCYFRPSESNELLISSPWPQRKFSLVEASEEQFKAKKAKHYWEVKENPLSSHLYFRLDLMNLSYHTPLFPSESNEPFRQIPLHLRNNRTSSISSRSPHAGHSLILGATFLSQRM